MLRRRQHAAHDAVDQQRHQNGREGELDFRHTHDEGIDQPALVAGDQAQRDADDHRQHDAGEADQQRDAAAIEDGGEHVTAEIVGAQQIARIALGLPERRQLGIQQVQRRHVERIVRRHQRREHRGQDHHQRDDAGDDGHRRFQETVEDVAVQRALQAIAESRHGLVALVRHRAAHQLAPFALSMRRRGSTT